MEDLQIQLKHYLEQIKKNQQILLNLSHFYVKITEYTNNTYNTVKILDFCT
jgi:hypothetical protein